MKQNICMNCIKYKKIYNKYLKSETYLYNLIQFLKLKNTKKKIIENYLDEYWDKILDYLTKLNEVIYVLKQNINLKNSLIGDFIKEYSKVKTKLKSKKSFYNIILYLVDRPNFYIELKQFLYIISNKKRCNLLVYTKKIRKKLNKTFVKSITLETKDNIDLLRQYLLVTNIKTYWGDKRYNIIREVYEMLYNIDKYYKDPLKIFKIKYKKKKNKSLIEDILLKYVMIYKNGNFDNDKIDNISSLIVYLKKKITIWEAINLIFTETITCTDIDNIEDAKIIGNKYIEYQRGSYRTAFKIYILVKCYMISNINIFNNYFI